MKTRRMFYVHLAAVEDAAFILLTSKPVEPAASSRQRQNGR